MPTFAQGYIQPSFNLLQQNISTPATTPGPRVMGIAGEGSKTLPRTQSLTRGASANPLDGPLQMNTVIGITSVQDANGVTYAQGRDYQMTRSAGLAYVDWSPVASVIGTVNLATAPSGYYGSGGQLDGLGFNITVNGVAWTSASLALNAPSDAANVVTQINQAIGFTFASLNANNQLVLSANSIQIADGPINSLLGFAYSTFNMMTSSLKPAQGTVYSVNYISDKLPADYGLALYTDNNVIDNTYGIKKQPSILYTGTVTGSTSNTLTDTTQNWAVNSMVGQYVRITGGTCLGQVRVIIGNTPNTLTLSQPWNTSTSPDATSFYSITDINLNTCSIGAQIGKDLGAGIFLISQYPDDIFNTPNMMGAIDAHRSGVGGYNTYSLVLMHGMGPNDASIELYLKKFVTDMSALKVDRWCDTVMGMASGTTNFLSYVTTCQGLQDGAGRIQVVDIPSIYTRDYGYGDIQLDGRGVAAAWAGVQCSNQQVPFVLAGQSIAAAFDLSKFVDPFPDADPSSSGSPKLLMGAAGVTVFQLNGADLVCVDDMNTDQSSLLTKTTQYTLQKDYCSNYIKSGMTKATVNQLAIQNPDGTNDYESQGLAKLKFLINNLQTALPPALVKTGEENPYFKVDKNEADQANLGANLFLTPTIKYVLAIIGFGVGSPV